VIDEPDTNTISGEVGNGLIEPDASVTVTVPLLSTIPELVVEESAQLEL
jgi:hypothetical protein